MHFTPSPATYVMFTPDTHIYNHKMPSTHPTLGQFGVASLLDAARTYNVWQKQARKIPAGARVKTGRTLPHYQTTSQPFLHTLFPVHPNPYSSAAAPLAPSGVGTGALLRAASICAANTALASATAGGGCGRSARSITDCHQHIHTHQCLITISMPARRS